MKSWIRAVARENIELFNQYGWYAMPAVIVLAGLAYFLTWLFPLG